ncbi:N-6 DNA methylase [Nesterenkonia suensis]
MTSKTPTQLVSASDIAEIAGVSRAAVSNWRRRRDDFPRPAGGSDTKPLFDQAEVLTWLRGHGYEPAEGQGIRDFISALFALENSLSTYELIQLGLRLLVAQADGSDEEVNLDDGLDLTTAREAAAALSPTEAREAADALLIRAGKSLGHAGADFASVGSPVTSLLGHLAVSNSPDSIYDPTCGIGSTLLDASAHADGSPRLIGHDINIGVAEVARLRGKIAGLPLEVAKRNVLSNEPPQDVSADAVVSEPPFGLVNDYADAFVTDARYRFGAPPRHSLDMAWLQVAIASLNQGGRGYVVLPASTTERSAERRIRNELVRHGCVEAVVALPPRLSSLTSIELVLWVLRPPSDTPDEDQPITLVNSTTSTRPAEDICTILRGRGADTESQFVAIPATQLLAADSDMSPAHWITAEQPDAEATTRSIRSAMAAASTALTELQNLDVPTTPQAAPGTRTASMGELMSSGLVTVHPGRWTASREQSQVPGHVLRTRHVVDGRLPATTVETPHTPGNIITEPGDVALTTTMRLSAMVDEAGGHEPDRHVVIVRSLNHASLPPRVLAASLQGEWNARFQSGGAMKRLSPRAVKLLEIPLMPRAQATEFAEVLEQLDRIATLGDGLLASARRLQTLLATALHYDIDLSAD